MLVLTIDNNKVLHDYCHLSYVLMLPLATTTMVHVTTPEFEATYL